MQTPRASIESWVRRGRGPVASTLRRAATSALGTYGAYVAYGLLHGDLRRPQHDREAVEPLAGDDLIAAPDSTKTFAIDVAVPPEAVWPYLVQMGYGRAGWYGWYPLENGARGSAVSIVEDWQTLGVGSTIPDGPDAAEGLGSWRVVALDQPKHLILFSRRVAMTGRELAADAPIDEPTIECSWAFVLRPAGAGSRLIVRVRARYLAMDGGLVGRATRRFFDLGDTVMEWTMLDGIKQRAERIATMPAMHTASAEVRIPSARGEIFGSLTIPENPRGVAVFVHDGGNRHRLRNLRTAWALQTRGLATLILDLHTGTGGPRAYDVDALAERLVDATDWAHSEVSLAGLPMGYVAASAGAAAALRAAAMRASMIDAIVAFSGRFDLGKPIGSAVRAPTLLVVGGNDEIALQLSRDAMATLPRGSQLVTIPGAAHMFEEPGALVHLAELAGNWLLAHLPAR